VNATLPRSHDSIARRKKKFEARDHKAMSCFVESQLIASATLPRQADFLSAAARSSM
jgi:hypothetical protein